MTYRGKPVDPRDAGRELNVRYLVEGDVRVDARGVVVGARLVETDSGTQIWTRVAGPAAGGSPSSADLIPSLARGIRAALFDAEQKRVARLPDGGSALLLVLQAYSAWDKDPNSLHSALAARKLFEEAIRIDPNSLEAMLGLFYVTREQLWSGSGADDDRFVKELDEWSTRAVQANRDDVRAWIIRSEALQRQSKFDGAIEALAQAQRIEPESALFEQARLLLVTGRVEESFPVIERALVRNPSSADAADLLYLRCRAHLLLGRYADAIAACEQAGALNYWWLAQVYLVAAYAQNGDLDKAAAAKVELLRRQPGMSIERLKQLQRPYNNPTHVQQREAYLSPGLKKAGFPER